MPHPPPPHPHCRRRGRAGAATALLAAACLPAGGVAQHARGSALFNATAAAVAGALTAALQNAPGLEDVFYPAKYRLPIDFYVPSATGGAYTQGVIFDPCRQYGHGCCNDTFGAPEFAADAPPPLAAEGGGGERDDALRRRALRADGTELPLESSRRPDDELRPQPACDGPRAPHADCVASQLARAPFRLMPRCWNFNASVVADRPCRAPADGSPVALCLELGVTQTALVVECGGRAARDGHCGTYLEVHRPGHAGVLAEARLPGMLPSGYRMAIISTTYQQAPDRVLCYDPVRGGRYEVWWVQRTLHNLVLERRVPFAVVSPLCDWDADNNRYAPWATVDPHAGAPDAPWTTGEAVSLVDSDPLDPARFRLSRERVEGDPLHGRPGKGMGGTMVTPQPEPQPALATRGWEDPAAYVYTPPTELETVRSGRLEPPNVPPDRGDFIFV